MSKRRRRTVDPYDQLMLYARRIESLQQEKKAVETERDRWQNMCTRACAVLAEPGIMDIDEWKAWKRGIEREVQAALEPAK